MSFDLVSINFFKWFYFINKPVNKVQFKAVKENKLQDFFIDIYIIWFYSKQTPQGKWEMFALCYLHSETQGAPRTISNVIVWDSHVILWFKISVDFLIVGCVLGSEAYVGAFFTEWTSAIQSSECWLIRLERWLNGTALPFRHLLGTFQSSFSWPNGRGSSCVCSRKWM